MTNECISTCSSLKQRQRYAIELIVFITQCMHHALPPFLAYTMTVLPSTCHMARNKVPFFSKIKESTVHNEQHIFFKAAARACHCTSSVSSQSFVNSAEMNLSRSYCTSMLCVFRYTFTAGTSTAPISPLNKSSSRQVQMTSARRICPRFLTSFILHIKFTVKGIAFFADRFITGMNE